MAGSLARPYAPVALIVVKLRKSSLSSYVTAPTRPRCSGNNSSSPLRGAGQLPRAVISAATGRAGVTSKACLATGVRRPATRRLVGPAFDVGDLARVATLDRDRRAALCLPVDRRRGQCDIKRDIVVARTLKPESNFLAGMPGEIVSTPIVNAHCKKPFWGVEAKIPRVFLWRQGIRANSDQIAPRSPPPIKSPSRGRACISTPICTPAPSMGAGRGRGERATCADPVENRSRRRH
jgi:hypothetical protein